MTLRRPLIWFDTNARRLSHLVSRWKIKSWLFSLPELVEPTRATCLAGARVTADAAKQEYEMQNESFNAEIQQLHLLSKNIIETYRTPDSGVRHE